MQYHLPVNAILIAIVFVAIVIGIIMKYSMSKINKQNIIETIRNDIYRDLGTFLKIPFKRE